MTTPVYKFRDGSRFSGNATAVALELESIRLDSGSLDPDAIVETAHDPESALHPHFPWDDAAAAHQHRLDIARRLVRSVVIVRGDNQSQQSMYVHVPSGTRGGGAYEPLATIVSKPDAYLAALAAAKADLDSAHRRVTELRDIAQKRRASKSDVAAIMLAAQALQTANEALQALH